MPPQCHRTGAIDMIFWRGPLLKWPGPTLTLDRMRQFPQVWSLVFWHPLFNSSRISFRRRTELWKPHSFSNTSKPGCGLHWLSTSVEIRFRYQFNQLIYTGQRGALVWALPQAASIFGSPYILLYIQMTVVYFYCFKQLLNTCCFPSLHLTEVDWTFI